MVKKDVIQNLQNYCQNLSVKIPYLTPRNMYGNKITDILTGINKF
jgi:hypothetical protein